MGVVLSEEKMRKVEQKECTLHLVLMSSCMSNVRVLRFLAQVYMYMVQRFIAGIKKDSSWPTYMLLE